MFRFFVSTVVATVIGLVYSEIPTVAVISGNNFTDTLMEINKYPEPYWASLLPEPSESASSANIALTLIAIEERFVKFYDLIDFAKMIEFIENIPNNSTGTNVKKIMLYIALLSAAETEGKMGESEVLTNYFDVAVSFDEFRQNLNIENVYVKILLQSISDKYNGCYKSVMHSDSEFLIKNEKYGEHLCAQPAITQRVFTSSPSDISENVYTPIFTSRQLNRTTGFIWEIKREKKLFWLKNVDFDRYMDTSRCDLIHSTNGTVALPELAFKIFPFSGDTEFCRVMNVNTKQFLFAGGDDAAEDDGRRTILCGQPKIGSDKRILNWKFEEFDFV